MGDFKNYIKHVAQPMRPYMPGEDLEAQGISVWDGDVPEEGGMIAVNPKNEDDKWYVAKAFFEENYVADFLGDDASDSLGVCDSGDCNRDAVIELSDVRTLCQKHYERWLGEEGKDER